MNVIDEVIAQIKMTQPIKMVGCAEGEFVPLNRVLALLEMASEREKMVIAHHVTKALNELMQDLMKSRGHDDKVRITSVTHSITQKISEVQGEK